MKNSTFLKNWEKFAVKLVKTQKFAAKLNTCNAKIKNERPIHSVQSRALKMAENTFFPYLHDKALQNR